MTEIEKYLSNLERIGEAASAGPWEAMENPEKGICFLLTPKGLISDNALYNAKNNIEFMATSRNEWSRLIGINRKLLTALEWLANHEGVNKHLTDYCGEENPARQTLAEVNKMVDDER